MHSVDLNRVCKTCENERKKREALKPLVGQENAQKRMEKAIRDTLQLAQSCVHFYREPMILPNSDMKTNPRMGDTVCLLEVECAVGHIERRYGSCSKWRNGEDCKDRSPR